MKNIFYKEQFRRPLIYLISPTKVNIKTFPYILSNVLDTRMVKVFQLRLKNYKEADLIKIASLLNKICIKKNVTFILNDRVDIAKIKFRRSTYWQEDGSIKVLETFLEI